MCFLFFVGVGLGAHPKFITIISHGQNQSPSGSTGNYRWNLSWCQCYRVAVSGNRDERIVGGWGLTRVLQPVQRACHTGSLRIAWDYHPFIQRRSGGRNPSGRTPFCPLVRKTGTDFRGRSHVHGHDTSRDRSVFRGKICRRICGSGFAKRVCAFRSGPFSGGASLPDLNDLKN